jgi:Tfp pilus assembly protein PilF
MARLDALRALVEQSPADSRVRYMLALELAGTGDWEAALVQLKELIGRDPAYVAAYYQAGQAAERLERLDDARELYRCGVEAAHEAGDVHAERELSAALDVLG